MLEMSIIAIARRKASFYCKCSFRHLLDAVDDVFTSCVSRSVRTLIVVVDITLRYVFEIVRDRLSESPENWDVSPTV